MEKEVNEEVEKSNKGLIAIIVILCLMVLGLGGYIAYDKLYTKDAPKPSEVEKPQEENNKENETNEDEEPEETIDEEDNCVLDELKGEILKYPTKNDNSVKVTKSDHTIYKYNNYNVTFSNNNDASGLNTLKVFDKNNKLIYSTKYLRNSITEEKCDEDGDYTADGKVVKTPPIISDGKLYFISLSSECYKFYHQYIPYYSYNYIDLKNNKTEVVNIQNLKLEPEGEMRECAENDN